jgi:hypothetical protein
MGTLIPMPISVVAIHPKNEIIATSNLQKLLEAELSLKGFSGAMIREMASYPAAMPWKNPPPKKGPRAGGRRTGDLGTGWRMERRGALHYLTVNKVPYVGFVQGFRNGRPKQTAVMRGRNWQQIDTASDRVWSKRGHRRNIVRILTQRDPRLDRRRRRRV